MVGVRRGRRPLRALPPLSAFDPAQGSHQRESSESTRLQEEETARSTPRYDFECTYEQPSPSLLTIWHHIRTALRGNLYLCNMWVLDLKDLGPLQLRWQPLTTIQGIIFEDFVLVGFDLHEIVVFVL